MDRRLRCGQAVEIGKGLGAVVGVAIMWLLAQEAWNPLKATADEEVTNATAQEAINWTGLAFENFLVIALGITCLGVIAFAAFQRQGGFR